MLFGEYVVKWCFILLLSVHPKKCGYLCRGLHCDKQITCVINLINFINDYQIAGQILLWSHYKQLHPEFEFGLLLSYSLPMNYINTFVLSLSLPTQFHAFFSRRKKKMQLSDKSKKNGWNWQLWGNLKRCEWTKIHFGYYT